MAHGGKRKGAGRKPKIEELELIEKLDNVISETSAIEKLDELIQQGNYNAIKLYFEYKYGKPKEKKDINLFTEQPIFPDLD